MGFNEAGHRFRASCDGCRYGLALPVAIVMAMVVVMARMATERHAHAAIIPDNDAAAMVAFPVAVVVMVVMIAVAIVSATIDVDAFLVRLGRRREREGSDAKRREDECTNDIHGYDFGSVGLVGFGVSRETQLPFVFWIACQAVGASLGPFFEAHIWIAAVRD